MIARTTSGFGILLLLGAAAPATAPPSATPSAGTALAGALPAGAVPWLPQPPGIPAAAPPVAGSTSAPVHRPASTAPKHPRHPHRHHRHHPQVPPTQPLGEIRSQIAQTVTLIDQMDQNLHNQISQGRADSAEALARLDAQARQLDRFGKRMDGLDDRFAAEARERRQGVEAVQRGLAEHQVRLDAQEARRLTTPPLPLPHREGPAMATLVAALIGVLLAAGAMVLAFRQRSAAIAAAEGHADRLYRTYRAEFETLAQAARELEARMHGGPRPAPTAMHIPGERAALG